LRELRRLSLLLLERDRDCFLLVLLESQHLDSDGLEFLTGCSKLLRESLGALMLLSLCFAQLRHMNLSGLCGFLEGYSGLPLRDLKLLAHHRKLES
jgi:hypothetical protein